MDCQLAQPGFWLDAIQAASVFFGVFIAWRGLRTWRHEVIGRRQIEVAEEALGAFLRLERPRRSKVPTRPRR